MDAVVAECEFLKGAPIAVVGDLNCSLEALPAVQMGIDANQWFDVAGIPHLCRGGLELVTCKAHGSREWRRRDFVLCNARAKPWVKEVWTESQA
eukprot:7347302-Alexandrium_andersonii.AAC.1